MRENSFTKTHIRKCTYIQKCAQKSTHIRKCTDIQKCAKIRSKAHTFENVRTFKNAHKSVQKHTHLQMLFKNRPQKRGNALQNNTHSKMCGYSKPSRNSIMCTPFFRSKTHTSETAHQNSKRSGFWPGSRSKLAT